MKCDENANLFLANHVQHCAENEFDCFKTGQKCLDYSAVCNGLNDCGGWEDEARDLCDGRHFLLIQHNSMLFCCTCTLE